MRTTLLVDALTPQPGGIGRYTWELCKGLRNRGDVDVSFVAHGRVIEDPAYLLESTHPPRRGRMRLWLDRWAVQSAMRQAIVHGPNYFLPHRAERGVITAHDLSVFRFPETHPVERVLEFEERFRDSLDRSVKIITDTETVRNEIIEMFSVQPEKVVAVPLGVSPSFRPRAAETLVGELSAWDLQAGLYGLCVSTLEPRKKIAELLAAWESLPLPIRTRFPLVLAGGAGWRNDSLRASVDRGVAQGWLKYLGFVDEAAMPALYAGARLFIYPSTYEGFGLPPLEAMASGVPVMVSNQSCLPEVCGNAATFVDPDDIEGFRTALEDALTDDQARERHMELGLARASSFSWARCIEGTVSVYRTALAQG